MQEIEVKAKVNNQEALIEKLKSMGCALSEPVIQKDRIFIPQGMDAIPVVIGINVLRIREQDGKSILTLKQSVTNQLDCIEHELEISDAQQMIEIFKLLGFHEVSQVSKKRRKGKHQDLEICLDEVDKLGTFIEVEKLAEAGDGAAIQKELFDFLENLGVSPVDRIFDGYDVMIAKLNQ